ncbi:hypothetical protein HG531_000155 [Fusarium graminearum]|nr:hypothetical protein HG531_000155 [Fusarium graminearum]
MISLMQQFQATRRNDTRIQGWTNTQETNLSDGRPQTSSVHKQRDSNKEAVEAEQHDVLGAGEELVPVHVEPKDTAKAKGEPRDGRSRGDGQDGVKDGDGVGEDEAEDPEDGHDGHPDGPRAHIVGSHLALELEVLHHLDVHVLDTSVAKGKSRREDGREHDTVGNLGDELGG